MQLAERSMPAPQRDWSGTRFDLGVCAGTYLLFVLIAWAWAVTREARPPAPNSRVAVWLCDRDGNRVVGLDRNLLEIRSVPLRAPLEVEGRADGGAWIVSAAQADPLGPHELARLSAAGALSVVAALEPVLDLYSDELGRALVLDLTGAGARLQLFEHGSEPAWSRVWPGALCAALCGDRVLAGTAAGNLALFDLSAPNAPPHVLDVGGVIADVAQGPRPGTWWSLDAQGSSRLLLLDEIPSPVWSTRIGLHALHLAPVPGAEQVWVADSTQPHARRFGPEGRLEIDRPDMPLGGLDRACAWSGGAALFTAPGALLHLDPGGLCAPGQAGFDFLVDVSVAR